MASRNTSSRSSRSSSSRSSRSGSSGSRRVAMPQKNPRRTRTSSNLGGVSTVRVGDIRPRTARRQSAFMAKLMPWLLRLGIVIVLALLVVVAGMALAQTSLFGVKEVEVSGVEHLTAAEVTELAAVPANTTLLRVDTAQIEKRLEENAWIEDAQVNRKFPSSLELAITERTIAAVVEIPVANSNATEDWAISSDGIWLMLIPEQGSEDAAKVSAHVYEDAEQVLHVVDVPYGSTPVVGGQCDESGVLNALEIVRVLSPEFASQVQTISASDEANTTLNLTSGVEIAFGSAEGARDKERICTQLLADHPDQVSYINVRVINHPTWRAIS